MGLCHEVGAHCKPFTAISNKQALRLPFHWPSNPIILSRHLLSLSRHYATSDSPGVQKTPTRKQVTIRNDDGRVEWKELTTGEKAARTTQQTFNFGVILAGLAGTITVGYFLYTEVFASDSKTRIFNRAVDRVRADPQALELLGSREKIRAFGEPTSNKWSRNRPLASSTKTDQSGIEHLYMQFNVVGSANSGIVHLHMAKGPEHPDWQYQLLALDVQGYILKKPNLVSRTREPASNGSEFSGDEPLTEAATIWFRHGSLILLEPGPPATTTGHWWSFKLAEPNACPPYWECSLYGKRRFNVREAAKFI